MNSPKNTSELPVPESGFPSWNADPQIQSEEQARALVLMQYFDGELDEEAARSLEAELSEDELQQLQALELGEDLLCESIDEDSRGDGISSRVMAEIQNATSKPVQSKPAQSKPVQSKPVQKPSEKETHALSGRGNVPAGRQRPANDNARSIWALAAAAAAVAAGLFVWGKTAPGGDFASPRMALPATVQAPAEPVAPGTATSKRPQGAQAAAKSAGAGSNVEVDFGSHEGSVFLVGSGNSSAAMSAVVWVTDGDE